MNNKILVVVLLIFMSGCSSLNETCSNNSIKDLHEMVVCTEELRNEGECACTQSGKCYHTPSKVYAGTLEDVYFVALPFIFLTSSSEVKDQVGWVLPFIIIAWPAFLIDLPFSAISDTILYFFHKYQDQSLKEEIENSI